MPASIKPSLLVFIIILGGYAGTAKAQDSLITIQPYLLARAQDSSSLWKCIRLAPEDSLTGGIGSYKPAIAFRTGDRIRFLVNPSHCFVYLLGIDARNNYFEYDRSGRFSRKKNTTGFSKSIKLGPLGTEHFMLLFSSKPLDTAYLHFFAGIEMSEDEVFARRVKRQIGSRLADPALFRIDNGKGGIRILLSEAGNRELESNILPIVVDIRVSGRMPMSNNRKT